MPSLRYVLLCSIAYNLLFLPYSVHAVDKTWDNGGPNSFWDEDDNWTLDEKPQPADKAIIGGGDNPEVNTLEIFDELENGGTIDITAGTLQPQGDTDNSGIINVGDGSAILSHLLVGNSTTLSGSGEVVLKNSDDTVSSNATISGGGDGSEVTNGLGHTIRGEGTINLHWINEGIVRAEETSGDASAVLRLDNTTFTNHGELRSSAGASIEMKSFTYSQNASGQLIADTGDIALESGSITGGSLETISGGVFQLFDGNGSLNLSAVTINAPIDNTNAVGNHVIRADSAGITNNSTITLDGQSGGKAQFGFTSSGMLGGSGEIVLVGGDADTFVGVLPGTPFEFTQGASHTIRGAGFIASPIINNGTIRAEPGTNGSTLSFNQPQTNNGLIEASSGTTINFSNVSGPTQSASGVISAADGSTVELNANTTTGGRLETTGSGRFVVINSSTVNNVTNAGNFDVPTFKTLNVGAGALTNDGTITINSDGGVFFSVLQFNQDTLLDGTGEIFLNGANNSSQANIGPNGNTITQDSGHIVRGDGQIIGSGTFVNNGRIEGDSAADPVRIRTRLEGVGILKDVSIDFDSSGTVHAPGNSVGTVPLEGNYSITHAQAHLEIEIGGLTPGTQHDQLSSTGTVDLGGTLDVLALDLGGYTPTAGDRFDIIESTSAIAGTFFDENFPSILGARAVTWLPVDYLTDSNKVTLEIATADFLAGDFDENGMVDDADLAKWEAGFGMAAGAGHMDGDADGDFDVDGFDFLAWQRQFGIGVSPLSAGVATVPEPSSVALFLVGAILVFRRRAYRFTHTC